MDLGSNIFFKERREFATRRILQPPHPTYILYYIRTKNKDTRVFFYLQIHTKQVMNFIISNIIIIFIIIITLCS